MGRTDPKSLRDAAASESDVTALIGRRNPLKRNTLGREDGAHSAGSHSQCVCAVCVRVCVIKLSLRVHDKYAETP